MVGLQQVYHVIAGYSIYYHLATALVVWVGSDFYEFAYHRLGHISFPFWKQHKHHHVFFNPSPFAVIADEWIDQVFREAHWSVLEFLPT